MKKKNYLPTFFLFLALYITGGTGSYAQHTNELSVKKITCTVSPESEAVPALLDQHHIAYHPLDRVNWKDYPYRPEVSFRIAHTGKEILLHYKVTETGVRALATEDNGRVWEDSCVEFFVSPQGNNCYYNFECNAIGKLLIQGGTLGESRPTAPLQLTALVKRWSSLGTEPFAAKTGPCSWQLTLVIPVSAFFKHALPSFDGMRMKGNFYKCGDKLPTPHFLSWNPILLERPQFHCPAFFGILNFE